MNAQLYIRSHPWTARLDRSLDLGNRRVGGDKRLNVFHYPLEGWVDAVTMNMLMGTATAIQLGDLVTCSYRPLAAIMAEVAPREASMRGWARSALPRPSPATGPPCRPRRPSTIGIHASQPPSGGSIPTASSSTGASACAATATPTC